MIREAHVGDIPAMLELGRLMHAESPRYSRLAWSDERMSNTLWSIVGQQFAWVAVENGRIVGGMLAMCAPHWCSPDMVATDLALFMAPEARGTISSVRLVIRYILWARNKGAKLIQLGVTTGVATERTVRLLERLGLSRCGVILEA